MAAGPLSLAFIQKFRGTVQRIPALKQNETKLSWYCIEKATKIANTPLKPIGRRSTWHWHGTASDYH